MRHINLLMLLSFFFCVNCSQEDSSTSQEVPRLIIRLNFDANQIRLNNLGQPAEIPEGNAAQTPVMHRMSAHYLEFTEDMFTQVGAGSVVYQGDETTAGGEKAIDFQEAFFAGDDDVFLNIPLDRLQPGTYNWVRVSLSYQEGDIQLLADGNDLTGRLASFVGYNTYISNFMLNNEPIVVNDDRLQGFWAFETAGFTTQGQAPPGATTVPNPLFETSPIPQGSCIVTGEFEQPFVISGNETNDVTVTLSFSINESFEWTEITNDGKYEPSIGEQVVDMGLRGLIPTVSSTQ